jgi:putative spermidine/putrescine transport system permease protein
MKPSPLRLLLMVGLLLATALPLATLLLSAFGRGWFFPAVFPPAWQLASWQALGSHRLATALLGSLLLGGATATLATLLALPAGRVMARSHGAWRGVVTGMAFLPVAAPPIALATGLQLILFRAGLGGTVMGVVIGHLIPATGYLALYFAGVFDGVDAEIEASARTLGATPWQVGRHVLLPLFRRPIVEAMTLAFLISWAQVPLTLVLGGGVVRTLPLEVASLAQSGQDGLAAAAGLLLTVPALVVFWLVRRFAGVTRVVAA